jgi:hypothetical protein
MTLWLVVALSAFTDIIRGALQLSSPLFTSSSIAKYDKLLFQAELGLLHAVLLFLIHVFEGCSAYSTNPRGTLRYRHKRYVVQASLAVLTSNRIILGF